MNNFKLFFFGVKSLLREWWDDNNEYVFGGLRVILFWCVLTSIFALIILSIFDVEIAPAKFASWFVSGFVAFIITIFSLEPLMEIGGFLERMIERGKREVEESVDHL